MLGEHRVSSNRWRGSHCGCNNVIMRMRSSPRINPEIDTEHGASSIFLYPTNEAALVCPRRGKVVCGVVGCRHVGWHSFDGSNFLLWCSDPSSMSLPPPFLQSIFQDWSGCRRRLQKSQGAEARVLNTCEYRYNDGVRKTFSSPTQGATTDNHRIYSEILSRRWRPTNPLGMLHR